MERTPKNRPLNKFWPETEIPPSQAAEEDYCLYKNYTPIAKNQNVIYYMELQNTRQGSKFETQATLWRFDMEKGINGTESEVVDFGPHGYSTGKYGSMYAS